MPQITSCPECSKKLRVPDELIGKKVKCPGCTTMFIAEADDQDEPAPPPKKAPPKALPERSRPDAVTSSPRAKRRDDDEEEEEAPRPRAKKREEDEDERPPRRGRRDEEEDDEDRRPRRGRVRDDDDDDRPSRRRDEDEDDDDDEDRPRRRRDSGEYASRREQRLGWEKVRAGTNFVLISGWLYLSLMLLYLVFTLVISLIGGAGGFNNLSSGNVGAMGVLGCGFALVAGLLGLTASVLLLVGTGFCMATPRLRGQTMKGMAMTAFYLYVGSTACYLVSIVLTIVIAPLGLLGIIAASLAAVAAHIVWILYLRLVSLYFRDPGLARSLVTNLIAMFVVPVLGFLLILLLTFALRSVGTAGAIVMGIFSILLFLVSIGIFVWYLMLLRNVRDLVDR